MPYAHWGIVRHLGIPRDRVRRQIGTGQYAAFCSPRFAEGPLCLAIATDALARDPRLRRRPIAPAEVGGIDGILTAAGDLRTLPCHLGDPDPRMGGLDGFFAVRFERF